MCVLHHIKWSSHKGKCEAQYFPYQPVQKRIKSVMTFARLNWVFSEEKSISLLRGEPPCISECLKKVISPSSQKVGEGNYGNHPSTQLFLPTPWHPVDDGQWILPLLLSRGTNSTLITNHTQKHPSGLELLLTKLKLPKEFIIDLLKTLKLVDTPSCQFWISCGSPFDQ